MTRNFYWLIQGDARKVLPKLRDASIDLIITDPPYTKDGICLYEPLAREGKRLLKNGRYLFAYCGAQFLPKALQLMTPHLDWFWLFEIKHSQGKPRMWSKKIMVGSKPVLAFTKGKPYRLKWMCSLHSGEKMDKRYHKWGQHEGFIKKIVELLTNEGDVVLDPFLGGGTTMKVCQDLRRNCIGIEINPEHCEIVKKRCFSRTFLDREVEYKFEVWKD